MLPKEPPARCPNCGSEATTCLERLGPRGWVDYFQCWECGRTRTVERKVDDRLHDPENVVSR